MLLDLGELLRVWRLCWVRDRLYAVFRLLHDILVLKTLDVALLALHIGVEKGARLIELAIKTYLRTVTCLKSVTPSKVLELKVKVQDIKGMDEIDVSKSSVK